jgi:hypothetical protein
MLPPLPLLPDPSTRPFPVESPYSGTDCTAMQ